MVSSVPDFIKNKVNTLDHRNDKVEGEMVKVREDISLLKTNLARVEEKQEASSRASEVAHENLKSKIETLEDKIDKLVNVIIWPIRIVLAAIIMSVLGLILL